MANLTRQDWYGVSVTKVNSPQGKRLSGISGLLAVDAALIFVMGEWCYVNMSDGQAQELWVYVVTFIAINVALFPLFYIADKQYGSERFIDRPSLSSRLAPFSTSINFIRETASPDSSLEYQDIYGHIHLSPDGISGQANIKWSEIGQVKSTSPTEVTVGSGNDATTASTGHDNTTFQFGTAEDSRDFQSNIAIGRQLYFNYSPERRSAGDRGEGRLVLIRIINTSLNIILPLMLALLIGIILAFAK